MDQKSCQVEGYRELARRMVEQQIRARGVRDERVLRAMEEVPRHRFVPGVSMEEAYADRALPTQEGQTISQPYMVALMTELLEVEPGMKVLEIGTGSGYQSAILAYLGANVISIERSERLAEGARRILEELGYSKRVKIYVGDGTLGWAAEGPYERILATAGAPRLPRAFEEQVVEGGRIVIPIGDRYVQQLMVYRKKGGRLEERVSIACRFVPMIGADGWSEAEV